MLRFFRTIRKSLMEQNKTRAYILYAIGEITLVMIGILLALQVNNWNENQKQEALARSYIMQIQNELLDDIQESKEITEILITKAELLYKIMYNQNTIEELTSSNGKTFLYVGLNESDFLINTNGFDGFINTMDEIQFGNEALIKDLKEMYINTNEYLKGSSEMVSNAVGRYLIHLETTKPWFNELFTNRTLPDDAISYMMEDPFYKNYMSTYNVLAIGNFLSNTQLFQYEAFQLYQAIDKELGTTEETPEEILNLFSEVPDTTANRLAGTYFNQIRDSEYKLGVKDSKLYFIQGESEYHLLMRYDGALYDYDRGLLFKVRPDSSILHISEASILHNKID